MRIGRVLAVERLFRKTGLSWNDIDLVELNEARPALRGRHAFWRAIAE